MQNDLNALLNEAKELLKKEITPISYDTWIKDIEIDSIQDNNIFLSMHDNFKIEFVKSRYGSLINNTFNYILHKVCTISFVLTNNESENNLSPKESTESNTMYSNSTINPKYTFDTFVVGENNSFAHAASLAVAEAPATAYNPLFIYGGPGLGKTHLMYAIGNEILKSNKNLKVLYVSAEEFTNEFVNAIKNKTNEAFRNKYRNIDVLLIDDIQFISGKDGIQEEFFHTFESLHKNGKQIVIACDTPPRDIALLENRLRTRFEWGIMADISMADYETRLAILRKKTDESKVIIPDDVLSNIAIKIDSNIRELEGVFRKLVAHSEFSHTQITFEMSEKAINDIICKQENVVSVETIQETVSKFFTVSCEDLISSKRSNEIAFPRQVAMYLCRSILDKSYKEIAKAFKKKDHSTVIYACKQIDSLIKTDLNTKQLVESVKNSIVHKSN